MARLDVRLLLVRNLLAEHISRGPLTILTLAKEVITYVVILITRFRALITLYLGGPYMYPVKSSAAELRLAHTLSRKLPTP